MESSARCCLCKQLYFQRSISELSSEIDEIIGKLPFHLNGKAKTLLNAIIHTGSVKWDKMGMVFLNDECLGTDIITLIEYTVSFPRTQFYIAGMGKFIYFLCKIRISHDIIHSEYIKLFCGATLQHDRFEKV
jgi:hypothetical protein